MTQEAKEAWKEDSMTLKHIRVKFREEITALPLQWRRASARLMP